MKSGVLDLFHFEFAFEVKLNFYMQPKAEMWHMRKAPWKSAIDVEHIGADMKKGNSSWDVQVQ